MGREIKLYESILIGLGLSLIVFAFTLSISRNVTLTSSIDYNAARSAPEFTPEISYHNLTEQDEEIANFLLAEIYEEFLSFTKEIHFTYEMPEEAGRSCGIHYPDKKIIYIEMDCQHYTVASTLCHEVLHPFIPVPDGQNHTETRHVVIDLLAENYACYKPRKLLTT